jgi:hypothetical protein
MDREKERKRDGKRERERERVSRVEEGGNARRASREGYHNITNHCRRDVSIQPLILTFAFKPSTRSSLLRPSSSLSHRATPLPTAALAEIRVHGT